MCFYMEELDVCPKYEQEECLQQDQTISVFIWAPDF